MTAYSTASPSPITRPRFDRDRFAVTAACWLVGVATVFNFVLSFINASVFGLSSKEVIAFEGLIIACCHLMIIWRFRSEIVPWYVLLWFLAMIGAARWFWLGHIDPKTYRDVLIIPTFICLGMVVGDRGLDRTVIWIQVVVLAIALVEIFLPTLFSSLVNVKQYYINTRGFDETAFWNSNSDLFVSATRPQVRSFFPSLDLHRVSSVFLEPVSLGNYCTIITAFVCGRFHSLSWRAIVFFIVSNFVLLVACDGRLAVNTSVLIVAVALVARRLPYVSIIYLPCTVAVAFLVHYFIGGPGTDDFVGRVALTAELVGKMSLSDLMGVPNEPPGGVMDSGFAYMLVTQSIFGMILLWLAINLLLSERNGMQARSKHGILVYLSLTMIVSYSFLSIKTAAVAWFMLGAIQIAGPPASKEHWETNLERLTASG